MLAQERTIPQGQDMENQDLWSIDEEIEVDSNTDEEQEPLLESDALPHQHESGYESDLDLQHRRYHARHTPQSNDLQTAQSSIFGNYSQ